MEITYTFTHEELETLLWGLRAAQNVIEATYAHDEETGERIKDMAGDSSAADVVEMLCNCEVGITEALELAEGAYKAVQEIPSVYVDPNEDPSLEPYPGV